MENGEVGQGRLDVARCQLYCGDDHVRKLINIASLSYLFRSLLLIAPPCNVFLLRHNSHAFNVALVVPKVFQAFSLRFSKFSELELEKF